MQLLLRNLLEFKISHLKFHITVYIEQDSNQCVKYKK